MKNIPVHVTGSCKIYLLHEYLKHIKDHACKNDLTNFQSWMWDSRDLFF